MIGAVIASAVIPDHPQMQIPLGHILVLSSLLFSIGVLGVLLRRNAIVIFMSIELMLNAVNLSFVGFANQWTRSMV